MYLAVLAVSSKVVVAGRWELQEWPLKEDIRVCSVLDTAGSSPFCNGPTGEHSEPISHSGHFWENLCKTGQEQTEDLRVELRYNLCAENYLSMDVLAVWEGRGL